MSKLSPKEREEYVPKLKDVFSAPEITQARERKNRLVAELEIKRARLANWLDEEIESCFTEYMLPAEHRKQMRSTNMIERLNQVIKAEQGHMDISQ